MMEYLLYFALLPFSVFGFCCAVWMLADWIFSSDRVSVAIEVIEQKDADMLDMLLHEARSAFFKKKNIRPVVLVSTELMRGIIGEGETLYEPYASLLNAYGAECYLVEV